MMGHLAGFKRFAGVVTAVSMMMVLGGVAAASVDDDLAVAMQGVKRGLRAVETQRASLDSGAPDSRLALAVAAVDDLVAERIETDPTLTIDDVLEALISEVPETGDSPGPLGEALDAVKLTGQELAEEKRSDAPGQADEDPADTPASPGNAGGNDAGGNNAGGNDAGGNNAGGNNGGDAGGEDRGNAGGKGNADGKGNAGGGGGNVGGNGRGQPGG